VEIAVGSLHNPPLGTAARPARKRIDELDWGAVRRIEAEDGAGTTAAAGAGRAVVKAICPLAQAVKWNGAVGYRKGKGQHVRVRARGSEAENGPDLVGAAPGTGAVEVAVAIGGCQWHRGIITERRGRYICAHKQRRPRSRAVGL